MEPASEPMHRCHPDPAAADVRCGRGAMPLAWQALAGHRWEALLHRTPPHPTRKTILGYRHNERVKIRIEARAKDRTKASTKAIANASIPDLPGTTIANTAGE
jgi:hypothetical protein